MKGQHSAYLWFFLRFTEPEQGKQIGPVSKALIKAHEQKQQVLFSLAPYGNKIPEGIL